MILRGVLFPKNDPPLRRTPHLSSRGRAVRALTPNCTNRYTRIFSPHEFGPILSREPLLRGLPLFDSRITEYTDSPFQCTHPCRRSLHPKKGQRRQQAKFSARRNVCDKRQAFFNRQAQVRPNQPPIKKEREEHQMLFPRLSTSEINPRIRNYFSTLIRAFSRPCRSTTERPSLSFFIAASRALISL